MSRSASVRLERSSSSALTRWCRALRTHSTPADVIQYRSAARSYHIVRKLDPEGKATPEEARRDALYNLMFYGEHTWGYSSSITEPFHPQVNNLDQWKRLYALKACESAVIAREALSWGDCGFTSQRTDVLRGESPR